MKTYIPLIFSAACCLALVSCKNRDINEGEAFKPREIHEDIVFHFDKITVDGIEYLILEKDNNNPHEGFGFMALRGNKLMEKQDTILAYLRTITDLQIRTYAAATRRPIDQIEAEAGELFRFHLDEEAAHLLQLEQNDLLGNRVNIPVTEEESRE